MLSWGQTGHLGDFWRKLKGDLFGRGLALLRGREATVPTPSTEPELAYRPDIDGLRALAVLPVVFFHFDFPGFSGGFIGVDIFFVISGYLITSLIVAALDAKSFSVARFYRRRIQRIIPAFIVLLVVVALASIALLPPKELALFGLSAAAAAAFCSNIFFALHTGYFAGTANMMPLLHTWSLGVEEQFYILWPLMLIASHRIGSRFAIRTMIVALAAASLAYSQWATTTNAVGAFFFLQSRAWELMLGAMLALGMVPVIGPRWLRDGLALLGVAMIAFAVTRFSPATPFPGLWATIPCLGAVFIIQTGQTRDTVIYRLLGLWPCVFVGLISYSLYLWHWPIFSFTESYLGRGLTFEEAFVLLVASIAIATMSWRYVEQPFHHGERAATVPQGAYFLGGLGALALAGFVGAILYLGDGLPGRLGPETLRFYQAGHNYNPLSNACLSKGHAPSPASLCTRPASKAGKPVDILVWGDSHGDAVFPALVLVGEDRGLSARQATKRACPPLLDVERLSVGEPRRKIGTSGCAEFNHAMLEELRRGPRPRLVMLIARWSLYAESTTDLAGGREVFLVDDEHQALGVETSRRVLARALGRTVDAITALGIPVLLVGQSPEFSQDPNICFVERAMYGRDVSDCLRLPRQAAEKRLRSSKKILLKIAKNRLATTYVGLDDILCDAQACWAKKDGQPLYADQNHLSMEGAQTVGAALLETTALKPLFVPEASGTAAELRHHPISTH